MSYIYIYIYIYLCLYYNFDQTVCRFSWKGISPTGIFNFVGEIQNNRSSYNYVGAAASIMKSGTVKAAHCLRGSMKYWNIARFARFYIFIRLVIKIGAGNNIKFGAWMNVSRYFPHVWCDMDEIRDKRCAYEVLSSCEFHENRRRKCHTFPMGMNEIA
jgi:hypothetical protein